MKLSQQQDLAESIKAYLIAQLQTLSTVTKESPEEASIAQLTGGIKKTPDDIQKTIAVRYTDYAKKELSFLLKSHFTLEKLGAFLKTHWNAVKGTVLCYTALPLHPRLFSF